MAKGKHSTALFEVINKPVRAAVAPPPVLTRAHLPPVASASLDRLPAPSRLRHPRITTRFRPPPGLPRLSYTSALVSCFAVVVVIVLAYLLGHSLDHSSHTISTAELKNAPPHPAVLNVAPANPAPTYAAPRPIAPASTSSISSPTDVKRITGQNYVIVQSYPDESAAKEAQSVLLSNGISCTIERGPEKWVPMSWYSVIGTQAFDHVTRNPQLDAYIKSIDNIKYAEKSKFKKFEPRAYKWK